MERCAIISRNVRLLCGSRKCAVNSAFTLPRGAIVESDREELGSICEMQNAHAHCSIALVAERQGFFLAIERRGFLGSRGSGVYVAAQA